ncbi:MAG: NnrS family protein [Rhodocyclaceae bacterium]
MGLKRLDVAQAGQTPAAVQALPQGRVVFAAPHRAMFLSGGVMLLVSFLLWGVELVARLGAWPSLGWRLPPAWGHALLVLGGMFPFFIFGFLLTAMPRWQGQADVGKAQWLWPWRLLAAGWGMIVVGLWAPGLMLTGSLAALAGWTWLLVVLGRVAFAPRPDRLHAMLAWGGLAAGALAFAGWPLYLAGGNPLWVRFAIEIGVWGFLVPVFVTVCHRMIPFFSANVIQGYEMIRPRWVLLALCGASVGHGLMALGGLPLAWLLDAAAATAALWLSWRWRLVASLQVALLGVLHVGFAWLGIALALSALQGAAAVLGVHVLGLAPLHALAIGFFGSILFGMVSRVTLGHSGRALQADLPTVILFVGLQGVAVVRIVADLVPSALSAWWMALAAAGWLAVFAIWAARYLPMYLRPRVDGKPG